MRRLNKEEFYAIRGVNRIFFSDSRLETVEEFWSYFDKISSTDFQGFDCSIRLIKQVARSGDGIHDLYYLGCTEDPDTSMVLVVGIQTNAVVGHYLLNLKREWTDRNSKPFE